MVADGFASRSHIARRPSCSRSCQKTDERGSIVSLLTTLRMVRLSLLLTLLFTHAVNAQTVTLAITGGRILDGYGGPPIENGVILIAGERITAVGPASAVAVPAGVLVVPSPQSISHAVMVSAPGSLLDKAMVYAAPAGTADPPPMATAWWTS